MQVAIIGAGSWGTALAQHLAGNGVKVELWGRDKEILQEIKSERLNSRYLPGVILSEAILVSNNLEDTVNRADIYVLSVPTSVTREICIQIKQLRSSKGPATLVSTAKGLEAGSNKRLSEIIKDVFGENSNIFSFSGPSFALEVAMGMPTAAVLAGDPNLQNSEIKELLVKLFHKGAVRVYTSNDLVGVELGGVLKNVISVASGVGDGLGLGLNARAGLLTRGLKELSLLIQAEGGKVSTVMGLSGLGDLILTSTGDLSRNRRFGVLLGQGLSIEAAKEEVGQTIEALITCTSAYALSRKHGLDTPIIAQVAKVIAGETTPSQALKDLMKREQKEE